MSDERSHPHRDNLAAYALGALDADDIPALESHLAGCQDCWTELADYQSVTMGLLQSLPSQMPPSGLRRRLISKLPSHRKQVPVRFAQFSLKQVATVLVVLVLLGLNFNSSMQIRALQQQQLVLAQQLSTGQAAIAMLAYPGTQALPVNADVQKLTGSMLVDKDMDSAVLVLWGLPQIEAGKTYQIWLIDESGKRISAGLFDPVNEQGYTTVSIQSPVPIGQFVGLGVTIEPRGGSEGPTGPRVLAVNL
jgi:anti-sigma-K factor RskA